MTPGSVLTVDGREREVDTILLATGFETQNYVSAIDVTGRDGVHISEAWKTGPEAYLGLTTAGFPAAAPDPVREGMAVTRRYFGVDGAPHDLDQAALEHSDVVLHIPPVGASQEPVT